MSDADCTPGREPRSVAASLLKTATTTGDICELAIRELSSYLFKSVENLNEEEATQIVFNFIITLTVTYAHKSNESLQSVLFFHVQGMSVLARNKAENLAYASA